MTKSNYKKVTTKDPDRLLWNNNCCYDKHGQVIAAQKIGRGVMFCDLSRNLKGVIIGCGVNNIDIRQIMGAYDLGTYDYVNTEEQELCCNLITWGYENLHIVSQQ